MAGIAAEGDAATKKKAPEEKSPKKEKSMLRAQTLRVSTLSFEVGVLTASSLNNRRLWDQEAFNSRTWVAFDNEIAKYVWRINCELDQLQSHWPTFQRSAATSASVSVNPNAGAASLAEVQPNQLGTGTSWFRYFFRRVIATTYLGCLEQLTEEERKGGSKVKESVRRWRLGRTRGEGGVP